MVIALVDRSQLRDILAKPCYQMNLVNHAKVGSVYSVIEGTGTMNAVISQILYPGGKD